METYITCPRIFIKNPNFDLRHTFLIFWPVPVPYIPFNFCLSSSLTISYFIKDVPYKKKYENKIFELSNTNIRIFILQVT